MVGKTGVRIGTAAVALGLSLAGPHAAGLASADDGSGESSTVSAGPAGEAAPTATSTRRERRASQVPVRTPRLDKVNAAPRPGAAVRPVTGSRAAAVVADPPTREVRMPATRESRKVLVLNAVPAAASPIGYAGVSGAQPAAIRSAPILDQLNSTVVGILDAASRLLSGLPAGPLTDLLAGALLLVRRGLFDQAPDVVTTQKLTSALQTEGLVIADDPEGDPVEIELAVAPTLGTVTLAADGSYLYTPGPGYAGSDSFTVRASDANGGFNLLAPFSDGATLHTVAITGAGPATVLTVNLRTAFIKEVTGTETGMPGAGTLNGSYVYLYQPQPATGAPNWTKLIDKGQITKAVNAPDAEHPDFWVNVALNAQGQQINGGATYLIVQSENPTPCQSGQTSGCHTDLTEVTDWAEAFVQQKVQAYNYGYTAFEYALLGQAGDQGDITYIPGFGPHVAVKVCDTSGSCDTRGLAKNATDFVAGLLTAGVSPDAVFTYPSAPESGTPYSPLDGKPSIVISPSNGTFGASYYPEANWNDYLTETIDTLPANAMKFSGTTAGSRDAAGIWHNGQYYSYSVQAVTDGSDNYYLFSPDTNSQTQGYMLIKQSDVGKNLYAPGQGSALATLYDSVTVSGGVITALGTPYDIPGRTPPGTTAPGPGQFNVSANNQWGNALTQYFTGFTAGNWGAVAEQANPVNQGGPGAANLAGPVDLNTNLNWDPAYAFDRNRLPGTAPAYQHNDQYSFYFYENANTYASAFSDNLAQKLNPGPQISLATGPGVNQNVSKIDLYVFGSDEPVGADGDGFYKKPVSTNYLAKPSAGDYLVPTAPNSALTLQVQGFNVGSKIVDDASVKLGIYRGVDTDNHAQFDYVTLPTTTGGAYQYFTISGGPGAWTAGTAGANKLGFIQINGLPMPATVAKGDVYWYQLVIADSAGANQRVFNVYATAGGSTPGELTPFNPGAGVGSANDPSAAIDNNAGLNVFTTYTGPTFDNSQITVNLQPDASLPAALLTNGWDPNTVNKPQGAQPSGVKPIISALAAPVVGQLVGGRFTPVAGQYGTGVSITAGYTPIVNQAATTASGSTVYFDNPLPTANVTGATAVAFGWTGTNSYAGEPVSGGVSYAPTLPVFETAAPFNMTQAGQAGQYTNKILPGNTARVTVKQGSTVIGTVDGVGDLDGQWQTAALTLAPGTYTATMTELTPSGQSVVDYLGRPKPDSVAVTIVVAA